MLTLGAMHQSQFILPTWNAPSNVIAYTTTRAGGFSGHPFASLNLAQHVGDDPATVEKNRELLPNSAHFFWLNQTHSTMCLGIDGIDSRLSGTLEGDASFSKTQERVCAVMTADCLPILLCDRYGTTVAAVHAGWRGLADGVIENTVGKMGVPADNLLAWLGPAISQANFEVGEDVKQRFAQYPQAFTASANKHKYFADLYFIARQILIGLGINTVSGGDYCTYQDEIQFFSHRRACHQRGPLEQQPATTGRMVSAIYLSK